MPFGNITKDYKTSVLKNNTAIQLIIKFYLKNYMIALQRSEKLEMKTL